MSSESTLHIRFGYREAFQAKKDILSAEMDSLKIVRSIMRYKTVRLAELGLKSKIYSRMKDLKLNIRKLENVLPKSTKLPSILKKEEKEEAKKVQKKKKAIAPAADIESQLSEIQKKLAELQK